MRILFFLSFSILWLAGASQQPQTIMQLDTTRESREYWSRWLTDQFEMGVEQINDSLFIREEVIKILKDSIYRNSVYPKKYDWPIALKLMKAMDLKKAFWHLINIYMTDTASHSMIIGTVVLYDSLMDMGKMLVNAYYTYAFTDPRVCRIQNGKPDIFRPDLLEKHLNVTKEIIHHIWFYRQKTKQ